MFSTLPLATNWTFYDRQNNCAVYIKETVVPVSYVELETRRLLRGRWLYDNSFFPSNRHSFSAITHSDNDISQNKDQFRKKGKISLIDRPFQFPFVFQSNVLSVKYYPRLRDLWTFKLRKLMIGTFSVLKRSKLPKNYLVYPAFLNGE